MSSLTWWQGLFCPTFTCAYCEKEVRKDSQEWSHHAWGSCIGKKREDITTQSTGKVLALPTRTDIKESPGHSYSPNSKVTAYDPYQYDYTYKSKKVERKVIE